MYHQLKELSVEEDIFNSDEEPFNNVVTVEQVVKLVNIIARCRNLTTLRLIIPGIENAYGYLFEHCTKIVDLAIHVNTIYDCFEEMFRNIKKNCTDIKSIQVITTDSEYSAYIRLRLRGMLKMFPDASISLAISLPPRYYNDMNINNPFIIPVTAEMVNN